VIDKLPSNYLRLGLVALLAPGARIIDCRRDPMDSCVSCYTEHFAHGQSFSYDLEALAAVWSGYDRLMRHWKQVLPLRILEVNYERLVENPVRELKKVMDFMSLDWQKSINDPAMYRQPIRTASSWQARQAIHSKSVGRWTRFENHLLGLQQALVKHARHHAG